MTRVAFFGAGTMGREMVPHLVAAGHQVCLYNRTRAKAEALAKAGAQIAQTPAEAVEGAEIVISMVGDDGASRAVWLGPDGALDGRPRPGAIAVESSTLSHAWLLELSGRLTAAGYRFLDAPVTGGPDGARARALTLLVGGERAVLDAAWPVLAAYARRAIHFGAIGTGTAYKLMVNLMGAAQATALAEGLLLARKAGLDMGKVREALKSGAVASPLVAYLTDRMIDDNHGEVYFAARWRHKDAAYGLALAEELGQVMPTSRVAVELFERVVAEELGEMNSSVVIKCIS